VAGGGPPWRPARAPMGGGAPVGSRPWEAAKRAELGALELLVGSVRPGVLPTGESATGRTGRRRRRFRWPSPAVQARHGWRLRAAQQGR
jgi:hypothetical protein